MKKRRPASKAIWAYAYQILPPQPEDRLHAIKTLLDAENSEAQRRARTWSGRVVVEQQATHILVVTDSPEQNGEVNRKLEAALTDLKAAFSITTPMPVEDGALPLPESNGSTGGEG